MAVGYSIPYLFLPMPGSNTHVTEASSSKRGSAQQYRGFHRRGKLRRDDAETVQVCHEPALKATWRDVHRLQSRVVVVNALVAARDAWMHSCSS